MLSGCTPAMDTPGVKVPSNQSHPGPWLTMAEEKLVHLDPQTLFEDKPVPLWEIRRSPRVISSPNLYKFTGAADAMRQAYLSKPCRWDIVKMVFFMYRQRWLTHEEVQLLGAYARLGRPPGPRSRNTLVYRRAVNVLDTELTKMGWL